jgi:hypothetical protein
LELAEEYFPDPAYRVDSSLADAFRRCVWSAMLTVAVGKGHAQKITDAWEASSDPAFQTPATEAMDQYNNRVGRLIGEYLVKNRRVADWTSNAIPDQCYSAAVHGYLSYFEGPCGSCGVDLIPPTQANGGKDRRRKRSEA